MSLRIAPQPRTSYARRLGLFDGTMVVVGGIIGAGIFLNPAIVAQRVGAPGLILAAWALGGVVALLGSLCFAELGARRPEAGGGYVYLREALGPLPAFLYGWTLLLVINSGGIAAVGVTFASYTADLAGLPASLVKPLAIAAIAALTIINYVGIRPGATTQNVFTVLKLVALGGLILAGLTLAARAAGPVAGAGAGEARMGEAAAGPEGALAAAGALGAALIPVLFAYGGWQNANFVAGEVRDPQRNLPRALLFGVGIVVATYVLANVAYVVTLGAGGLAASSAPAADTMRALLGPAGGTFITAGIVLSTFGFLNLSILAAPRVYQAMADDGLFFRWAARLHPRYRTPAGAIVFQSAWAVVLLLSGTYGELLDWVVFGDWIFFGLVVVTLFVFRAREGREGPDHGARLDVAVAEALGPAGGGAAGTGSARYPAGAVGGNAGASGGAADPAADAHDASRAATFRTPGYPWVPGFFVLVAGIVVAASIASNPVNALLGGTLIAAGVPVFFLWRRRSAFSPDARWYKVVPSDQPEARWYEIVPSPRSSEGISSPSSEAPYPRSPEAPSPQSPEAASPRSPEAPLPRSPEATSRHSPEASVKGSPYIAWAKSHSGIRYNLAASGVRPCPAELLEPTLDDLTIEAPHPHGWPPLIDRIARRYDVAESRVVLAHGASMANHLACATLLEPGDDVLVEHPAYEPLVALPRYLRANVRTFARVPEDGWRLDPDRVAAALTPRTRLVILSHLHNPTGARAGQAELRALGELAEARGFHVLVDEVYLEWLYDDGIPSAARLSPRFIVTSSLTKAYGLDVLRAGWIIAPEDVADRIRRLQDLFSGHIAQPTQRLAAKAFDRAAVLLAPLRAQLERNRDLADRFIVAHERLWWVKPPAGTVGFVRLEGGGVDELAERLEARYETAVAPGRFFGMPDWFRIGFGMETAALEEGLSRIAAALEE